MGGKVAVYPGSFDPITNGHMDIINRGLRLFDKIIILVGYNPVKKTLFTAEERVTMIKELIGDDDRIEVDCFRGLMVDYVRKRNVHCILRGLRAMSDFEYEFQLALINRRLDKDIETVFLMTGFKWFYINSGIIKEAASFGGPVNGLVPDVIYQKLRGKYPKLKEREKNNL
jgi:pantetheine-phosphate adenylyltransferase